MKGYGVQFIDVDEKQREFLALALKRVKEEIEEKNKLDDPSMEKT